MGNAHVESVAIAHREDSTHAIFCREWQTYRKLVDYNYLFHREAYGYIDS